jgi:ABC-type sugar transport system substrate-binding protein
VGERRTAEALTRPIRHRQKHHVRSRRTRHRSVLSVLVSGLLGLALLAGGGGCGDEKASSGEVGGGSSVRVKIGFANITEDIPFAVRVREGIERAAKAAGNLDLLVMNNRLDGRPR